MDTYLYNALQQIIRIAAANEKEAMAAADLILLLEPDTNSTKTHWRKVSSINSMRWRKRWYAKMRQRKSLCLLEHGFR